MRSRPFAVVLAVLLLVTVPVAAHGNYISVDPQVSADGTVRIELAVVITDGFLVVRTDDGGEFGRPVGHRAFEGNVRSDYPVELDDDYWANLTGSEPLWVVLHRDDGDGEFELGDDPVQTTGSGAEVADRFALRRSAAGPVNVIAEHDLPQETDRNRVSIRTVRLDEPGYLVLRADESGAPGRIVGHRALSQGEHTAVDVTVNETFYERRPETFNVWAVLHTSDGDGTFNVSGDPAVRIGEARVMTRFAVKRTDPIDQTPTPEPTATGAESAVTATVGDDGADPTTSAGLTTETAGHGDHEHTHEGTASDSTALDSDDQHDHGSPTPAGVTPTPGQPGFGMVAAVVALLLGTLLGRRRA